MHVGHLSLLALMGTISLGVGDIRPLLITAVGVAVSTVMGWALHGGEEVQARREDAR